MRHVVRQVEEERFVLILLDEIHRTGRIVGSQPRLVGVVAHHLVAIVRRQVGEVEPIALLRVIGPHIVRVWQAVILVEAILQRQELAGVAQVPLPEDSGGVALLLEELAHRHLLRVDTVLRTRSRGSRETNPVRIATCQQSRPRGATNRLSRQEVREAHPLGRHPINIRCLVSIRTVAREVPVTHIVQVNQDDIRIIRRHPRHGKDRGGGQRHKCSVAHNLIYFIPYSFNKCNENS